MRTASGEITMVLRTCKRTNHLIVIQTRPSTEYHCHFENQADQGLEDMTLSRNGPHHEVGTPPP